MTGFAKTWTLTRTDHNIQLMYSLMCMAQHAYTVADLCFTKGKGPVNAPLVSHLPPPPVLPLLLPFTPMHRILVVLGKLRCIKIQGYYPRGRLN